MFNGDHELAIVAGLRAGCLGHYVSNNQRKRETRPFLDSLLMLERMDV